MRSGSGPGYKAEAYASAFVNFFTYPPEANRVTSSIQPGRRRPRRPFRVLACSIESGRLAVVRRRRLAPAGRLGPPAFHSCYIPRRRGRIPPVCHSRRSRVGMAIKSDRWIRRMAGECGMIEPFVERQVRTTDAQGRRVISYVVSSYRYDMRVAPEFKIFTNVLNAIVDPKEFDSRSFVEFQGDVCIVPPNSFALARSVEYFRIPRNVLTICVGKSTYARCGIITNVTPFEPEWEGHVTLEISNTTPLPARIYANEGICQVLFFEADEDDICEISYADKAGKYQRQTGVTLPKL